jgi:hypothetical protein
MALQRADPLCRFEQGFLGPLQPAARIGKLHGQSGYGDECEKCEHPDESPL